MSESRQSTGATQPRLSLLWDVLLIVVLLAGAYVRFLGINWDSFTHLHPDERFLTMVTSSLDVVHSLSSYFNTAESPLNPNNKGYGFYVYGDLPVIIVRYVGEWMHQTGYDQIHLVGRQLSAIMDLLTVLLVYLIANRLYKKGPLSLLAAGFAAFEVLPIQQAHFYTVDTFANFFGFLAFYFAARLLPNFRMVTESQVAAERVVAQEQAAARTAGGEIPPETEAQEDSLYDHLFDWTFRYWGTSIPYILFGAALGMAVASKLNAAALAILLPAAAFARWISLPKEDRDRWAVVYLRNLVIGAVVALIFFRIFQPYAFSGPGFFGITPNPKWVQNIRDQRAQASGDVDFPPALQWARRTVFWFPFYNMVVWGLGLPLGILAWAGFVWMGWRMLLKHQWKQHLLVWLWTALYFAWQGSSWNPTMRYFLLIYPSLAIIAAWAVVALYEKGRDAVRRANWLKISAWAVGVGVFALTVGWAVAFLHIYENPLTRVAASRWIYQNVPAPINVKIDTSQGVENLPLAFRSGFDMLPNNPVTFAFQPRVDSQIVQVNLDHVGSPTGNPKVLTATISSSKDAADALASGYVRDSFQPDGSDQRGKSYQITLDHPLQVSAEQTYYLVFSLQGTADTLSMAGGVSLGLLTPEGLTPQFLPEPVDALIAGQRYTINFEMPASAQQEPNPSPLAPLLTPPADTPVRPTSGTISEVTVPHMVDWEWNQQPKTVRLSIVDLTLGGQVLGSAEIQNDFSATNDVRGSGYTFKLPKPVDVSVGHTYTLWIDFVDGPGRLAIYGSKQANESSWDDALPVSLDGYNPYDYSMGIYRSDLNFEMYWDDNADKQARFISILNQTDYIFISSNRQWGTTVRLPERYPLTTVYYRDLLGCPADKDITWCYSVAQPGMFKSDLGFELVKVFQSEPTLDGLTFNSQFAEEAFSVYDHPKVLIFKKLRLMIRKRRRLFLMGSISVRWYM